MPEIRKSNILLKSCWEVSDYFRTVVKIFGKFVHIFGKLVNVFGKLVHIFAGKLVSRNSFEKFGAIAAAGVLE